MCIYTTITLFCKEALRHLQLEISNKPTIKSIVAINAVVRVIVCLDVGTSRHDTEQLRIQKLVLVAHVNNQ